jgi:hypothetical protein
LSALVTGGLAAGQASQAVSTLSVESGRRTAIKTLKAIHQLELHETAVVRLRGATLCSVHSRSSMYVIAFRPSVETRLTASWSQRLIKRV